MKQRVMEEWGGRIDRRGLQLRLAVLLPSYNKLRQSTTNMTPPAFLTFCLRSIQLRCLVVLCCASARPAGGWSHSLPLPGSRTYDSH